MNNSPASPSCPASPRAIRPTNSYVVLITFCGAVGLVAVLLLAPPIPWPLGAASPTEHPAWQQEACQQQHAIQGIPRIIHQSYKTSRLPPEFAEWQQSWLRLHPSWCYMFWTDQDNRDLVRLHYPWFLRLYDALPRPIMRADAARYLYMHKYGGLYSDLDIEAVQAFDDTLASSNASVLLAYMGTDYHYPHNIPNAFMASRPGHPLWLLTIAEVYRRAMHLRDGAVEEVTGPMVLFAAVRAYLQDLGVTRADATDVYILPPGYVAGTHPCAPRTVRPHSKVYAYDWHNATAETREVCSKESEQFDARQCKSLFPDALAVSYWAHSWEQLNKPTWANWR